MKAVVAYIRHEAFDPIRRELLDAGFPAPVHSRRAGLLRGFAVTSSGRFGVAHERRR